MYVSLSINLLPNPLGSPDMKGRLDDSPPPARTVLHLRSSGAMLGAESVVLGIAQHSREYGYSSVIGVLHDRSEKLPTMVDRARQLGIETAVFTLRHPFDVTVVQQLRRFVHSRPFSLIHTHGYREDFVAAAARLRVPLIATNHLWKLTSRRRRLLAWADALILRRFDGIVAVSNEIARDMIVRGVPRKKVLTIPNGVNEALLTTPSNPEARRAIRQQRGLEEHHFVVAMVSSLTPEKGHEYALHAMRALRHKVPAARLLIIGAGAEGARLSALCERLGLSELVQFVGWMDNPVPSLQAADVLLLASTQEGLPISMLEAMAVGLPVVATSVGEIPIVLRDYPECLVPARDPAAIASALSRLALNPERLRQLSSRLREEVRMRYTSQRMTATYASVYDRLVDSAR